MQDYMKSETDGIVSCAVHTLITECAEFKYGDSEYIFVQRYTYTSKVNFSAFIYKSVS